MTVRSGLTTIALGHRDDALLHNCRLEAGGGEAFGVEAILAHFQRHPLVLADATWTETPTGFAALGDSWAIIGDVYEGRIGRLWRLDANAQEPPQASVSVAFDPDMTQARLDVFARAEDHPDLPDEHLAALLQAGRDLVDATTPGEGSPFRARAWLIRALAERGGVAGLFAMHLLADHAGARTAGFTYAAVVIVDGQARIVRDGAGELRRRATPWSPCLVT